MIERITRATDCGVLLSGKAARRTRSFRECSAPRSPRSRLAWLRKAKVPVDPDEAYLPKLAAWAASPQPHQGALMLSAIIASDAPIAPTKWWIIASEMVERLSMA